MHACSYLTRARRVQHMCEMYATDESRANWSNEPAPSIFLFSPAGERFEYFPQRDSNGDADVAEWCERHFSDPYIPLCIDQIRAQIMLPARHASYRQYNWSREVIHVTTAYAPMFDPPRSLPQVWTMR